MDKMLKTFNISQTTITIKTKIKIISSAELFLKIMTMVDTGEMEYY